METIQLRKAREQKGWPQSRVAEALGVTTRTVSRWEQGQATPYPYYRQQLSTLFAQSEQQLGLSSNREEQTQEEETPISPPFSFPQQSAFLIDPAIPHGLRRFSNVFGRDEVLADIRRRIFNEATHSTALYGLPGNGKTALAVAIATSPDTATYFPDGVLWAGLGPRANVLGHLARWAKLPGIAPVGVEQSADIHLWQQEMRVALGLRRFLIVIDDVWKLEDALALTIGGPNCSYLLTSRQPQIAFEFAYAGTMEIRELAENDALILLAHYVPHIIQQHHDDVLRLIRAVGTLPLALTLMGQYLASQALSGQPRRLNTALHYLHDTTQRLHLHVPVALDARSSGLPENAPLSLYSAINLSMQQLDPPTQKALAALAIFPPKPNSFSEEAALAVSQTSVETLDTLWDTGLLESSGAGRYTLHQTIVDYARTQEDTSQIRLRLVHYIEQLLQENDQNSDALEYETANVLTALETAIEYNVHQPLLQALTRFVPFMRVQGLELVHHLSSPHIMSSILTQWGNTHLEQRQYDEANLAFSEALKLSQNQSASDLAIQARAQYGLAQLAQMRNDYTTAIRLGQQSLSLLEKSGDDLARETRGWLNHLQEQAKR